MENSTDRFVAIALPDDLVQRLRLAGGVDQASIDALLARDPALRTEVQLAMQQWALDHFVEIPDSDLLMQWADRYPFMLDAGFAEAVEETIGQAEHAGDTERARALSQRLQALANLRAQVEGRFTEMDAPPLVQALTDFLAADDEEAARQVFAQFQTLLQSEEAAQILAYRFGSDDPAAWQLMQARTQLLQTLRREAVKAPAESNSDVSKQNRLAAERAALLEQLISRQTLLRKLQEEYILASGRERAVLALHIEQEQEAIADLQRQMDDLAEEMGRDSGPLA